MIAVAEYGIDTAGDDTLRNLMWGVGILLLIVAAVYWLTKSAIREGVTEARRQPKHSPASDIGRPTHEAYPPPAATKWHDTVDLSGAPKIPDEPRAGRFKITGVDRATKMDTTWHVQADNIDNAKVKAELEGIVVTKVERAIR